MHYKSPTSTYLTVDPENTGSSQIFTQQDLDALPGPLVETTTSLVANLMPGASQSHDNLITVRGQRVLPARIRQRRLVPG